MRDHFGDPSTQTHWEIPTGQVLWKGMGLGGKIKINVMPSLRRSWESRWAMAVTVQFRQYYPSAEASQEHTGGATSETEGRVLAERVRAWGYRLAWTPGWSLKRPPSSLLYSRQRFSLLWVSTTVQKPVWASQKRAPSLTGWLTLSKFRDLMDKPGDASTLKDEENLICPASILPNHQVHCEQKTCEGPNTKGQGIVSLFFLQKARKM